MSSTDPTVVRVDSRDPDPEVVRRAASILRASGLVAIPTETVYGLAGRALDVRALLRIFQAKGRPESHPLIAHVLDEEGARQLTSHWPAAAARLAAEFWPGPLTLVVSKRPSVPREIAAGGDSVAIRAPSHPVARAILTALGEPVAAPSANRYQQLSPTTAAHVRKSLGASVDLIVDAGPCDAGIESTVVDVRADVARVLRPGAVSLLELRRVLGRVEFAAATVGASEARPSPGMDAKHYAPRARLLLVKGRAAASQLAARLGVEGARAAVLLRGEGQQEALGPFVVVRGMAENAREYAHDLFAALHELDDLGIATIVVEAVPDDEEWGAVADRLRRASSA